TGVTVVCTADATTAKVAIATANANRTRAGRTRMLRLTVFSPFFKCLTLILAIEKTRRAQESSTEYLKRSEVIDEMALRRMDWLRQKGIAWGVDQPAG